jgi:hypothetical protein
MRLMLGWMILGATPFALAAQEKAGLMDIGLDQVFDFINKTGILGFALLILWTGKKRVWVWGSFLESADERVRLAEARAETAEAKLEQTRQANDDRIERVVPALSESSHANIEARAEMQRLATEVATLKEALRGK